MVRVFVIGVLVVTVSSLAEALSGLLGVVGAVGESGHLNLQGDFVLGFSHVSVDGEGRDFLGGSVKGDGHFVAGLGVIGENEIHSAGSGVEGNVAGLVGLLHALRVRRNVHGENALHLLHVFLHFGFFFSMMRSFKRPPLGSCGGGPMGVFWTWPSGPYIQLL